MQSVKFRKWAGWTAFILFLATILTALIMSFFGGGLQDGESGMIMLHLALG